MVQEAQSKYPIHDAAEIFLLVEEAKPTFEDVIELAPGLRVGRVDDVFRKLMEAVGVPNPKEFVGKSSVYVHVMGSTSSLDFFKAHAVIEAIALSSNSRTIPVASLIASKDPAGKFTTVTPYRYPDRGPIWWGHYRNSLTLEDLDMIRGLWPQVSALQRTDKFRRVANALHFYMNGLQSDNADFALIAFTTCLESLFSTVEQEISFRLSLRIATFLFDDDTHREKTFEEAREVYRIRSRIVHGAAIKKDAEQAAIYLVEAITPSAEELARQSLLKILEKKLEPIFDNPDRINQLLDRLLFRTSLDQTLDELNA